MLEFLQFVFSYLCLACRRKRWLNCVANTHALFRLVNLEKKADVNIAREKCNGWAIYILLYNHCQRVFSMCQQVWLFTRYSPVLGIESNVLLNKKVVRNSMRHACEYLVQVLMKEKFSVYDAFFRKMISIIYRLLLTHPRSQGFSAAILVFLWPRHTRLMKHSC